MTITYIESLEIDKRGDIMMLRVGDIIGKKELVLNTIGRPVKAGSLVPLSDNDLKAPDVIIAIKKGYLVEEKAKTLVIDATGKVVDQIVIEEPGPKRKIKKPATRKRSKRKSIKKAIKRQSAKKAIKRPEDPKPNLSSWDPLEEEMIDKDESNRRVTGNVQHKTHPESAKSDMKSWDPSLDDSNGTLIDKEDSAKKALDQEVNDDLDVQIGEVDLSNTKKTKHKSIKVSSRKRSTKRSTKGTKKKSRSLKPVGRIRPEPTADGDIGGLDPNSLPNESGDIGFVDQEQDQERINRHPILRRRAAQNDEIE